jgi:ribose transport system ATP-binding protein
MTLTSTELLLDASGIAKTYGAVVALKSASLAIRPGEVHALMGANGAGKSTLVKILTGAVRPDAGRIAIRGRDRPANSPGDARRNGLVSVYQEPALIPDLDIRANLRLTETPVEPFRYWLGELGLTKLDLSAMAGRLPLASLRIIDLARALAIEPDVLMLDEMTAALPANLTERVLAVIGAQRGGDRSVIFISHRMIEIAAVCDRATVLREGETVGVVDVTAGSEDKIVELMLGQIAKAMPAIAERTAEHTTEARTPRMSVRGLASGTKLRDATFDLYPGEVLGVVALDGQGQDELFDVLAGSDRPSGGELLVDGAAVSFRHPADAIRAGLVYVAADRAEALLMQRSVRENIALPFVSRLRTWGWIDLKSEGRTVNEAVARLQVDARAGNEVRRLSGGNQQKVTIARWVAGGVRTMLCFDPTRGIDIRTKQQIYVLLRDLAEAGAAVLLYTSELKEIQLVCDRSIVIFGGQVVEEIAGTDADEATLLRAAYHLRSGAQLPEELVAAGTTEAAATATSTPPGAEEAVEAAEAASPVDEARAAERPGQAAAQATEPADVTAPAPADPAQHRDEAGS